MGKREGKEERERKEGENRVTKQRNKEREWTANRARPLDEFAKSRKKEGKEREEGEKKKKEKGKRKGKRKNRWEGGTKGKDVRCEDVGGGCV